MPWLRGEDQRYKPPRMTDEQMRALEQFIIVSPDANEFAKKVIIWVLRQTENLTRPVALSVWYKDYGADQTAAVQNGAHDMVSENCQTRLDLLLAGMGTEMCLEQCSGCFKQQTGRSFNGKAMGRTIWLSYILYDRDAMLLEPPSLAELAALALTE